MAPSLKVRWLVERLEETSKCLLYVKRAVGGEVCVADSAVLAMEVERDVQLRHGWVASVGYDAVLAEGRRVDFICEGGVHPQENISHLFIPASS